MEINFGPSFLLPVEPKCPVCGTTLDGVTAVNDSTPPDPGDFSVCAYCGTLLRYEEGLKLRAATQEDRDQINKEQPDALAVLDELTAGVWRRLQEEREMKKRWH